MNRKWDTKTLHNEISRLLPGYVERMYFEILKNSGGTLIRPNLPGGKDIDAKLALLLKSIADPSGWVHLRLIGELLDSFMDPRDKKLLVSPFAVEDTVDPMGGDGLFIDLTDAPDGVGLSLQNSANGTESSNSDVTTLNADENQSQSSSLNIKSINRGAKKKELSDSVEVLKYLPKEIVTGRPLEVTSSEDTIEGETNYLTVDRDNILATIFAELQ